MAEYRASLRWYAQRDRRAALRLEAAVERVLSAACKDPIRFPFCDGNHREAILTRFPFSVIYRALPNGDILVVAVAHASREPGYWMERA